LPRAILAAAAATVAALLCLATSSQAAPLPQLTIASTGTAVSVTGTPRPGANTFRFTAAGAARTRSEPAVVQLGAGVTPEAFMAQVHALQLPAQTPDMVLEATRSKIVSGMSFTGRRGTPTTTRLVAGATYVVLDGATSTPATWPSTSFTVPAAGGGAALPKGRAKLILTDFKIKAPRTIRRGTRLEIANKGSSVHFVVAIQVPRKLSDKAAIRAVRRNDGKPFAKSRTTTLINLVSGGTRNVVTPSLTRGRWILVCLYVDAGSHGMPHTALGMETVVRVR
jgi:hypothetical protein